MKTKNFSVVPLYKFERGAEGSENYQVSYHDFFEAHGKTFAIGESKQKCQLLASDENENLIKGPVFPYNGFPLGRVLDCNNAFVFHSNERLFLQIWGEEKVYDLGIPKETYDEDGFIWWECAAGENEISVWGFDAKQKKLYGPKACDSLCNTELSGTEAVVVKGDECWLWNYVTNTETLLGTFFKNGYLKSEKGVYCYTDYNQNAEQENILQAHHYSRLVEFTFYYGALGQREDGYYDAFDDAEVNHDKEVYPFVSGEDINSDKKGIYYVFRWNEAHQGYELLFEGVAKECRDNTVLIKIDEGVCLKCWDKEGNLQTATGAKIDFDDEGNMILGGKIWKEKNRFVTLIGEVEPEPVSTNAGVDEAFAYDLVCSEEDLRELSFFERWWRKIFG